MRGDKKFWFAHVAFSPQMREEVLGPEVANKTRDRPFAHKSREPRTDKPSAAESRKEHSIECFRPFQRQNNSRAQFYLMHVARYSMRSGADSAQYHRRRDAHNRSKWRKGSSALHLPPALRVRRLIAFTRAIILNIRGAMTQNNWRSCGKNAGSVIDHRAFRRHSGQFIAVLQKVAGRKDENHQSSYIPHTCY